MARPKKGTRSNYKCRCGRIFPMVRVGNLREKDHIKTIWCVTCRKRTPHKLLGAK